MILTSIKTNVLYVLNSGYCYVAQLKTNEFYLWHLRLVYVGQKGMQLLFKQGMLGKITIDTL